jgi:regulator of nucleoside diphosphate kinase
MNIITRLTNKKRKIPHREYELLLKEIGSLENKYSRLPKILRQFKKVLQQGDKITGINPGQEIVTINSTVKIHNLDTNSIYNLHIVHPKHEKIPEFKISVLSPVGISLYALPAGEVITCSTGMSKYRLKILEVNDC